MTQANDHTARYPQAAATLGERLPDEAVLWMGGQSLRHNLRWLAAILLLGLAAFMFAQSWGGRAQEILAQMDGAPEMLRGLVAWLLGHVYMVYLLAAASVLFAGCIAVAARRILYAVTDRSLVLMAKNGGGLFVVFPLNNIDRVEAENVGRDGVGDVRLHFISPVAQGRMQRKGCTLNAVHDAVALRDFLRAHVDGLPPADLPQVSLRG